MGLMTAKTVPQVKALHASGQNIFRRQSVDVLLARIDELEAKVHDQKQTAQAANALIASLRAEIDRLCAMLGEADSRLTDPPKGGDA